MQLKLSPKLKELAKSCPFPLYAVGGAVRDCLAGLPSSGDVDIAAPCAAEEFILYARKAGYRTDAVYKNTGTVKISADDGNYEFACFRTDSYVRGGHVPSEVFFTRDITADARRRDFKCNAVYYDIAADKIVDPLGGERDIRRKILSCVAPARKVFSEDGLRLMRLARQSAQTGFAPDKECLDGARANCALISDVSAERVWEELKLILYSDARSHDSASPYRGLELLSEIRVLDEIIPELSAGRGLEQRADFHRYDVLEHSLRAVLYAPAEVRLAALLHDMGKPLAYSAQGNFHRHEELGAQLAEGVLARLKAPKKLSAAAVRLIKLHMYDLRGDVREGKLRRFFAENADILSDLLKLKQADYSACADDTSVAPCVRRWTQVLSKMKSEGAPLTLKQLRVTGADIAAAGAEKSDISRILRALLYECAVNPALNEREKLLSRALKINESLKKL